jgi:hypothetical protein
MNNCNEQVIVDYCRNGEPIEIRCGDYYQSEKHFCDFHQKEMEERYPQGWSYYPGDVCKHGNYVGGCEIDYMCHYCELGE